MENNYHKINIVNANGTKLNLTLNKDADLYEWARAFRVILKWVTFGEGLINEILPKDDEL